MRRKNQERKEAKQQMPKYKYQLSRFSLKSDNSVQTNKKVGSVVERSIEEFRDDLKEQKKEAKSVSYEPNQ